MNPVRILPLALVFAATCAAAQDRCPVELAAHHGTGLARSTAADGNAGAVPEGMLVHLTLSNQSSREIVGAQFIAHGYSNKSRMLALSQVTNAPDLTKTVDLKMDIKANDSAIRDLTLSRFTAVTVLALTSLTYADGSTWNASSPGVCTVKPDPFMLVAVAQ